MRDVLDLIGFWRAHSAKDETGRVHGFLYTPDDPRVADFYSREQVFERRVFISFERASHELAGKFERALRNVGLEPWRYEPSEPVRPLTGDYTIATIKENYSGTASRLVATVRRCPAAVFIVSERSHRSPLCQLEAFAAAVIHGFWPEGRIKNEAGVYVVLENPQVRPLALLDRFWSRAYETDLEGELAKVIADEATRLAKILEEVEAHRAKVFRGPR